MVELVKKYTNLNVATEQCLTNNFTYGDIPIATLDITRNIQKLAAQAAPITPMALQDTTIPESDDGGVVYAEGEEE